ncbi:MAG: hypothetical protein KGL36_00905 [Gammaproteobacteria bacterium]|nr:hypothetical protein [Gammaproteobacteria bacterium]
MTDPSTPDSADRDRRRRRRTVVGIAAIFFVPLAAALYLYYGLPGFRPVGTVNHGVLVDPPHPVPALSLPRFPTGRTQPDFLERRWTLLVVGTGVCGEHCRAALYDTRQVRIALDQDMNRVQRVFLATGPCCDAHFLQSEHPDLITVRVTAAAAPLLAVLPRYGGVSPLGAGRIYLIDPHGNLMMSYPPNAAPKGMLDDLQRLLKLSTIG